MALAALLCVATIPDQTKAWIRDIAVTPDQTEVAVTLSRNAVHFYSLETAKRTLSLRYVDGSSLHDIEFSPDGQYMAVSNFHWGGKPSPIWRVSGWQVATHLGTPVTKTFVLAPSGLEYGDNGRILVGPPLHTPQLYCWDPVSGGIMFQPRRVGAGWFQFATHPTNSLIVVHELGTKVVRFWDPFERPENLVWGRLVEGIDTQTLRSMRFSPDGKRLLFLLQKGDGSEFLFFEPVNGVAKLKDRFTLDRLVSRDYGFLQSGKNMYVTGLHGYIAVVDLGPEKKAQVWRGHRQKHIHAADATRDGKLLLTAADREICIWDVETGKLLRTIMVGSG